MSSSPQPVAPPPLASVETSAIPAPETVHNALTGENEQPSPQPEPDLPPPTGAPPPGEPTAAEVEALIPIPSGLAEADSSILALHSSAPPGTTSIDIDMAWRLLTELALCDTNAASLLLEQALSDKIPGTAWPSIIAALLGESFAKGVESSAGTTASASSSGEDLPQRLDLTNQLLLAGRNAQARESLEHVRAWLSRQIEIQGASRPRASGLGSFAWDSLPLGRAHFLPASAL